MKAVRHLGILIVLSVIRVAFSFVPAHKGQWAESTHCHTHTASEVLALRSDELGHMMKVAVRASKAAGDLIVQHSKRGIAKTKKSNSRDLVTAIDVLCEKTIQKTILREFPEHRFLGEESILPGKEASVAAIVENLSDCAQSEFVWVVDPIDGTTNFVHNIPCSAPSIALVCGGEVIIGVIYDPWREEFFTAQKGEGSFLNQLPIQVSSQTSLGDSIIAMGSPPASDSLQMSILGVDALMPRVQSIRMLGSAALMLSWVACGRLTCYWEYDLSSWDVCAGALIVLEAGGNVTDINGNDFEPTTRKLCASNGRIHDGVLEVLQEATIR